MENIRSGAKNQIPSFLSLHPSVGAILSWWNVPLEWNGMVEWNSEMAAFSDGERERKLGICFLHIADQNMI